MQWILKNNYSIQWFIHYLDDYLMIGQADSLECEHFLNTFLGVCELLGVPVAMEKVEGPTSVITFLGLELDSELQQIRLPTQKLQDMLGELEEWQRKKATKHQLLSLVGKLSFSARAVPAGRLFTRRLISLSTKAISPPHPPQRGSPGRHHLVEVIPTHMEWHSFVCRQDSNTSC